MLKIKTFFKELNKLDLISMVFILITIIVLLTDPNFKNTFISWFCIFFIFANQVFMINLCQKSRRLCKNIV